MCLAGAPIDWTSVKQTVLSVYFGIGVRSIVEACLMVVYLRHLPKTICSEQSAAAVVFEDNLGAVSTRRNNTITSRTKHIDIEFHRVTSLVVDKVVDVNYIYLDRLPQGRHSREELGCTQGYFKPPHTTR